ncbi:unnamed protein product [Symbiodinium sp. CCMP2592]|nr:unnamed protein product [Symbiodinium sp. CCMP2592]
MADADMWCGCTFLSTLFGCWSQPTVPRSEVIATTANGLQADGGYPSRIVHLSTGQVVNPYAIDVDIKVKEFHPDGTKLTEEEARYLQTHMSTIFARRPSLAPLSYEGIRFERRKKSPAEIEFRQKWGLSRKAKRRASGATGLVERLQGS